MEFIPTSTVQTILCCQCGTSIAPNPANMCIQCIRNEVDITEGIPKQISLSFCRNCERYLQPPNQWIVCQLESKELLALCLKKLRGLGKVRLIDAGFIWTEPHSRRVKVKLTIQKEVFASTILQQVFVVEAVVCNQQCGDCAKIMAQNTWNSVVQIRQKVSHKRTFLYLEQLMLKYNAHKDTVNIKELRDGLDLFFSNRNHAIRLVDFLQTVVPIRYKTSEQIISSDIHAGTATFKYTYSVEIAPICKEDLICLPKNVAQMMGSMSQLVLVNKITNSIQMMNPNTMQCGDLSAEKFWRFPFTSLASTQDLVEYYVVDVDILDYSNINKKNCLADIQVIRVSDFGKSNQILICRCHLGSILKPGDLAWGYDLFSSNFNSDEFERLRSHGYDLPDVILVKKSYSEKHKKPKTRVWKLKSLTKTRELDQEMKESGRKMQQEQIKLEQDYELFLRDIEQDEEMRANINMYKDPAGIQKRMVDNESSCGGDEINLEDLLDDLTLEE
jgi:nonsense-mediated mRNA decay protein 3